MKCELCDKVYVKHHQCVWYCEHCCVSFHLKHAYTKHLKSKKHLLNTLPQESIDTIKQAKLSCDVCNKVFASIQSKKRHKAICNKWDINVHDYIHDNICVVCEHTFHIDDDYETKLKHIRNHDIDLRKVAVLKKAMAGSAQIISQNAQVIHNTTNHITNNITNNIVIYGNEDFSYIGKDALDEALQTKDVIPRLCKLMRNNPRYPENRNIRVTDCSRGKMRMFTENGWVPAEPVDTLNNMIMEASDILDVKTESGSGDFEYYHDKVDNITDKTHELDMAKDKGGDTIWARDCRRNITLQFVDSS